jgi:PKD repeat protein
MRKYFIGFLFLLTFGFSVHAAGLSNAQIEAIMGLLSSFGADASVVSNVEVSLRGGTPSSGGGSSSSCLSLNYNLYPDVTDAATGGEVSRLQQFLGVNPTGYFGPQTLLAVQTWQASHGVVSSGSPDTTGYGYVGPKTRAAMARGCGGYDIPKPIPTPPPGQRVSFSASPTSGGVPLEVKFKLLKASSGQGPYKVEFGDGSSDLMSKYECFDGADAYTAGACNMEVSHTYDKAGTYDANLWAEKIGQKPIGYLTIVVGGSNSRPAPEIKFSASPAQISQGQSATLSWNVTNANHCVLQYGSSEEIISNSGSKTVSPSQNTSYRLWCANNPGNGKDGPAAEKTVNVKILCNSESSNGPKINEVQYFNDNYNGVAGQEAFVVIGSNFTAGSKLEYVDTINGDSYTGALTYVLSYSPTQIVFAGNLQTGNSASVYRVRVVDSEGRSSNEIIVDTIH